MENRKQKCDERNEKKKQLYIIGGTMGAGKTAVCRVLKQKLSNAVFLDGDWCWDADPFQVNEETKSMVMDNICHLLNNFIHCSAYEHIIFCWVLHEQSIINEVMQRIDTARCSVKTVSLLVNQENLQKRIMADVAKGIRSVDVLDRSIKRIKLYPLLHTIKIDTSNQSIEDVAQKIMEL